jgi:hypothetical protein
MRRLGLVRGLSGLAVRSGSGSVSGAWRDSVLWTKDCGGVDALYTFSAYQRVTFLKPAMTCVSSGYIMGWMFGIVEVGGGERNRYVAATPDPQFSLLSSPSPTCFLLSQPTLILSYSPSV